MTTETRVAAPDGQSKAWLLFVRLVWDVKGRRYHEFRVVPAGWEPGQDADITTWPTALFAKVKGVRPGGIYEYGTKPGTTLAIFPTTQEFVDRWHVRADVVQWEATYSAQLATAEADRAKARAQTAGRRLKYQALEPFRNAYWVAQGDAERAYLLAEVLAAITSPSKLKAERRGLAEQAADLRKQLAAAEREAKLAQKAANLAAMKKSKIERFIES